MGFAPKIEMLLGFEKTFRKLNNADGVR